MTDSQFMFIQKIPHEFSLSGIYMPPMLVAAFLAILATVSTTYLLNRYRISRYFFYPPLVSLSLLVIYTVLIATYLLGA